MLEGLEGCCTEPRAICWLDLLQHCFALHQFSWGMRVLGRYKSGPGGSAWSPPSGSGSVSQQGDLECPEGLEGVEVPVRFLEAPIGGPESPFGSPEGLKGPEGPVALRVRGLYAVRSA